MTKKKNVTGYLAIEENGIEVWPKALVEAVYLACSEEMQRLKKVGTEKVVKMIPVCHPSRYVAVLLMSCCQKCENCRIRELPCRLKVGVRTDGMSCSNCSGKKPCSRPADYMWRTLGAMWLEYSVTLDQFRNWYPKVMTPRSIYVMKDRGDRLNSEATGPKGGKAAKKKRRDRGESPNSAEDKAEDMEGDGDRDRDGDKYKEEEEEGEEEEDERGDDQDPFPSTSRKHSQDSSRAASTPDRKPSSHKAVESSAHELQLKAENARLKKELESARSVQTEVESENERLRTQLLEFEKIVAEFMEDAMEKQMEAARFRQDSSGEHFLDIHACYSSYG